MKLLSIITAFLIFSITAVSAQTYKPAERVYVKTSDYVKGHFDGETPQKANVWVIGVLRDAINDVLNGADSTPVRYRYWQKGNKTLWMLNSIGKTMPITAGVVVEDGKVVDITVMTYRESHGHEVQSRFHRVQYVGAGINDDNQLTNPIDGISGSTLSVNSMKRMARIALLLHNDVTNEE